MANRNWYLSTIAAQAFDIKRRPRNAWETMLDMIASQVKGGPQSQNRAIAYFLNVSERTVRRWRNERILPAPRDRKFYFQKAYLTLINRSPTGLGGRVFFPVGFQFVIPEFLNVVNVEDLSDEYDASEAMYVKRGNPPPSVKPIPLAQSTREIEAFLSGGVSSVTNAGASQVRIERAIDPMKIWPSRIIERFQGRETTIELQSTEGYVDFFNPYDIPVMAARILSLIKLATSGSFGSASSLSGMLTRLHAILRIEYGFYSPGSSKRPNARLDHTAPFMRWFERMISLAIVFDREIEEAQEIRRERRNREMSPEQKAERNRKERERRARKKKGGKR